MKLILNKKDYDLINKAIQGNIFRLNERIDHINEIIKGSMIGFNGRGNKSRRARLKIRKKSLSSWQELQIKLSKQLT